MKTKYRVSVVPKDDPVDMPHEQEFVSKKKAKQFAKNKEAAHTDYWPNIQTTVAEMYEADIATTV